jgi:integrase
MNPMVSLHQRQNPPRERFIPNPKLKFMEQCREVMRFRRLALRSEEAYLQWIKRFLVFCRDHPKFTPPAEETEREPLAQGHHEWRHPKDMGEPEVRAFLTHLAVQRNVAAATQNHALNALVFLYRHVIGRDFELLADVKRAKRMPRVPVVLSKAEVQRLLSAAPAKYRLFFQFLYGTGLRLMVA